MPELPAYLALPLPPATGQPDEIQRWAAALTATLNDQWQSLVYVLNGVSVVDTLANRTDEPDLDHSFFTASDTGQTFVGIDGVWTLVPRDGGLNTTQVGTDADTSEKDLMTASVPADVLEVNGRTVFVEAWGITAANGNTKTIRLRVGATLLAVATGAINDQDWFLHGRVMRTGTDAQDLFGYALVESSNPLGFVNATNTADDGAAMTVKVTGQNGTATANDIVAHGFRWWVGGR